MRISFKIILLFLLSTAFKLQAQNPVPMNSQPALTYLETFNDVVNWTNGFSNGTGAQRWSGVAIGGSTTVPNATKITHATTSFATTTSSGGVHKDSINKRIMLLAIGATDNTNSAAIDLMLNFSGINAGTLSFDWASVNNGANTSNRKGSLRVYGSIDGINFTEITAAQVLNITNYSPTSGSVVNLSLPSIFNFSSTARLRFYYYNGTGGSSGSRPYIALDNIKVTASGNPCTIPTASATNLNFNTITPTSIQGSFTAANPAPDEYLVVATAFGSLTSNPTDSTVFNIGDNVGDGIVIYRGSGNTFTASNLNPQTNYTFYVFSCNIYCNGIIRYKTINPLIGSQQTPAGPPCVTPNSQPTNLTFSNVTTNSMNGNFTGNGSNEYLVVKTTTPTLNTVPTNTTIYNAGDALGNGLVVYRGGSSSFSVNNLIHSTTYYYHVFSINSFVCSNGPVYNITSPLSGSQTTNIILPCTTPNSAPTNLIFTAQTNLIQGFFNPVSNTDGYLVVRSTNNNLGALPINGTMYSANSSLGNGIIISTGNNLSFISSNLNTGTTYYFFIFAYNENCIGGPLYQTNAILTGNFTTPTVNPMNIYYGNLHAHSSYSDGNKDNGNLTPADDYLFAKNSLCLDFLGISEHNHYTASNNPGMLLSKYQLGINQANTFTANNPSFLALYGMEWGTLTNGGHVLVYGIDSLLGWETINGSPNYNIYVPQNDYLSNIGLFRKVNQFWNNNAFATLAHPSWSDFGNLANIAYSNRVDSSVVGIALESGPAFSTNINYTEPGSSMSYLPYFQQLLAKGYHVGPTIDHDNHNTTFGRTAYTRTAVISPNNTKAAFLTSMKNRRFYATQNCNTKVEFSICGQAMGSIFNHAFAPAINIYAIDPANSNTIPEIKLMFGIPGSGLAASSLFSINAYQVSYTDINLNNNSTGYYYAEINIGSTKTITSPIWYTRNDNLVLSLIWEKFTATALNGKSILKWEISNPKAIKLFEIERSVDGVNFNRIGSVDFNEKNNSYSFIDYQPSIAWNYYRIVEKNWSGSNSYSPIQALKFSESNQSIVELVNNPVLGKIILKINSILDGNALISISDLTGQHLKKMNLPCKGGIQQFEISIDDLKEGTFILTSEIGGIKQSFKLIHIN